MSVYNVISEIVIDKIYNDELSIESIYIINEDIFKENENDLYDIYNEGTDEIIDKGKKLVKKGAKKYNNTINDLADKGANMVVKHPDKLAKKTGKEATPEMYKKYKRDITEWKARFKVAGFLATGTIMIKPVDMVLQASMIAAMSKSNDPADKLMMTYIDELKELPNKIKNKINNLKNSLKNKSINENGVKKEINIIDANTSKLAKIIDKINRGKKSVVRQESESAYISERTIFDIISDKRNITDKSFDYVNSIIEHANLDNINDKYIIDTCIDVAENFNNDNMYKYEMVCKYVDNDTLINILTTKENIKIKDNAFKKYLL